MLIIKWLELYLAFNNSTFTVDYYIFFWIIGYFGLFLVACGAVIYVLVPPKPLTLQELDPLPIPISRHRRMPGVSDPLLEDLVARRRNGRTEIPTHRGKNRVSNTELVRVDGAGKRNPGHPPINDGRSRGAQEPSSRAGGGARAIRGGNRAAAITRTVVLYIPREAIRTGPSEVAKRN